MRGVNINDIPLATLAETSPPHPGTGSLERKLATQQVTPVVATPGTGESTTSYVDPIGSTNWPGRFYRIRIAP